MRHLKEIDVAILDMHMPEMDGVEATRHIREHWPAEQRPRIIAMTAHALSGDRERYLDAGMDDYVSPCSRHRRSFSLTASRAAT